MNFSCVMHRPFSTQELYWSVLLAEAEGLFHEEEDKPGVPGFNQIDNVKKLLTEVNNNKGDLKGVGARGKKKASTTNFRSAQQTTSGPVPLVEQAAVHRNSTTDEYPPPGEVQGVAQNYCVLFHCEPFLLRR